MATRLTTIIVVVIVSATFIAGLIVGAQRDDASGPVDLIIVNGRVYPGGGGELQEAVAVRGNRILHVGSNREVKRMRRAQTLMLDAHGAAVIPALNDSHVQLIPGALTLSQLDLSSADTIQELEHELRLYADADPEKPWIVGRNGDADLFNAPNVTARKILDAAVGDRPVLISSGDGSVAWANSRALEMARIDRSTRNPEAGTVTKDRTGEPTGVLKNTAVELVSRAVPPPTQAEKIAALLGAIAEAHKLGITSLQTVNPGDEELRLLSEIRSLGALKLRVYASVAVSPEISEAAVVELDRLRKAYPDDPLLKMGGVEIVCTADQVDSCTVEQLVRAITTLQKHNWQVMVRSADESDVAAAAAAFEEVEAAGAAKDRRHRVDEHLLGDAGALSLFGSHWPSAGLDPLDALEAAVAKPSDLPSALDAYTAHAAFASRDEQRKGTLAPGMLADIIILSNDIFSGSDALKHAAVSVTIFDGKVVYQRPGSNSN